MSSSTSARSCGPASIRTPSSGTRKTGIVADPAKVRAINHVGRFFKVKGPLSVPPSPQGRPVLIQAGGSPRGIRTAARFVDHVFGAGKGIRLMAEQRADLDAALTAEGRDPQAVGIIWSTKVIVAETEAEAARAKERLIADVPTEAVGVWLSHNTGFDMSTLPPRFSLRELNQRIVAANASPVGFVGLLAREYGEDTEFSRDAFFEHGLHAATGYATTKAGNRGANRRLPRGDVRSNRLPRRLHARPLAGQRSGLVAEHHRIAGA